MDRAEYMRLKGELVTAEEDERQTSIAHGRLLEEIKSFYHNASNSRGLDPEQFSGIRYVIDQLESTEAKLRESQTRVLEYSEALKGVILPTGR
jgi:hypothetical protein